MKNLLLIIFLIYQQILMNIAFTSSHMTKEQKKSKGLSYFSNVQSSRFRRESPVILQPQPQPQQLISVPGYRLNVNNTIPLSSAVFCPKKSLPYSLQSMIVSNTGSINRATLNIPNQPRSSMTTAESRGPVLVFNNLPTLQCYSINFSSSTSNVNPSDINKIQVQFVYNPSNPEKGNMQSNGLNGQTNPSPTRYVSTACGSITCANGGTCLYTGANGFRCQCDSSGQWLGEDCSKPNPCMRRPCNNGGQCYYYPDATYYCVCNTGYSGNNCQSSTNTPTASNNPCYISNTCSNGGTCQPTGIPGQFTCVCRQGYTGVKCQTYNPPSPLPSAMITTASTPLNSCGICQIKQSMEFGDRIINGRPVTTYVWPWIVSLQKSGSHFCGGTLIDADHVVTAAHCFESSHLSPNSYQVVAGLLNLQKMQTPNVQRFSIARIIRHEHYNSKTLANDIAIIKLHKSAQINSMVYPICLPNSNGDQDPAVGKTVQIAGWGYTNSATKQLAPQLQEANIQILAIDGDLKGGPGCHTWVRHGYTMHNAQQICAMSRDTRTDSCQGDSGGPLIRDINSKWYLFGIVSYGDSICASSNAAGVYTRVSAYTKWIQQKIKK